LQAQMLRQAVTHCAFSGSINYVIHYVYMINQW